jgi:hypothetical protein
MTPAVVRDLRACLPAIRLHWEALLRLEPVDTPLANPDALAHLIPHSLEEIFLRLGKYSRVPVSISVARAQLPSCDCGNNPYRAYFIAGEQAVTEAFVLLQAELPAEDRRMSDMAEVIYAVRRLARSNIDAFCGVCVNRGIAPRCRHTPHLAKV